MVLAPPVMLVHGWGGSFATTWEASGFTALLADAGRTVIGVDLLGHGTAPKPHEPEAYDDLTRRVVEALPPGEVDAIGFSLGAMTLLRAAVDDPSRFRRLVLAGIGRNVFETDEEATRRIVAAIESGGESDDNNARLFAQYASRSDNDAAALAAVMSRPAASRLTEDDLARVTCPVLIAVGDGDFVLPADRLTSAPARRHVPVVAPHRPLRHTRVVRLHRRRARVPRCRPAADLVTTDVDRAAELLRRGGLVAIPTETVYGLAADARQPQAVARIFDVKGRPRDHPLIVHLAGAHALPGWIDDRRHVERRRTCSPRRSLLARAVDDAGAARPRTCSTPSPVGDPRSACGCRPIR